MQLLVVKVVGTRTYLQLGCKALFTVLQIYPEKYYLKRKWRKFYSYLGLCLHVSSLNDTDFSKLFLQKGMTCMWVVERNIYVWKSCEKISCFENQGTQLN
jgi:hypothetical protein